LRLALREKLIAIEKQGRVPLAQTPTAARRALVVIRHAEARIAEARKVIERHGFIAHSLYTTTEDPPVFLKKDYRQKREQADRAARKDLDRRLAEIEKYKHTWVVRSLGARTDAMKRALLAHVQRVLKLV